jgi:outer membrane protein assembly factor BamD (BamD/ComL family)
LFLAAKYSDAAGAFEKLARGATDDERRRLRFELRRAQCAYFSGDYAGAAKLLEPLAASEAVAAADELRPALFFHGDALLQQGKHAEAAAALERFVRAAKGDQREAQFKLGLARLRAGDEDEAERAFAQVAKAGGDSPWTQRALFERGQLLYKQKKPQPAAQVLDRVASAADAPEELAPPARYLLGWIDFDAKRYEQAGEVGRDDQAARQARAGRRRGVSAGRGAEGGRQERRGAGGVQ